MEPHDKIVMNKIIAKIVHVIFYQAVIG